MGNCQAAEAATVIIQHPPEIGNGNGRVERVYNSISANAVMSSNPGHYVALVLEAPAQANGPPRRNHLKLLKPDDSLHIGHVYRLISFEDVLKEFAAKKSVKLGKLLKETGVTANGGSQQDHKIEGAGLRLGNGGMTSQSSGVSGSRGRHLAIGRCPWKPALQSIAESATG